MGEARMNWSGLWKDAHPTFVVCDMRPLSCRIQGRKIGHAHMSKMRQFFTLVLILVSSVAAFGAKKKQVEHAPLPAKVLAAKTVFIENNSNQPEIADKAYTQLKQWGRYKVVDSKDKADLVLVFTLAYSHTQHEDSDYVSLYNSKTQSYTAGVVPGGTSTITWTYTQMRLVDPITSDVMWADERPWLRKHSATDELMEALRQRVDEQERASGQ
jgi:hypothetical protein